MSIQEILEAHRTLHVAHLAHTVAMCKCGTLFENRPAHRAHVAQVLEQHVQEREVKAVRETAALMTPVTIGYQNLGQRATIRRCQAFLLEHANKIKEDTTSGR